MCICRYFDLLGRALSPPPSQPSNPCCNVAATRDACWPMSASTDMWPWNAALICGTYRARQAFEQEHVIEEVS